MIYNPIDGKHYCLTTCAKDKIERFILKPITILLTISTIVVGALVLGYILGVVSFLSALLLLDTYILPGESFLTLGFIIITLLLLTNLAFKIIYEIYKAIEIKIDKWVSTPYAQRKQCKLFKECE